MTIVSDTKLREIVPEKEVVVNVSPSEYAYIAEGKENNEALDKVLQAGITDIEEYVELDVDLNKAYEQLEVLCQQPPCKIRSGYNGCLSCKVSDICKLLESLTNTKGIMKWKVDKLNTAGITTGRFKKEKHNA